MKKAFFIALLSILVLATGVAYADLPVKLYVNGQMLTPEVSPQIVNGKTLVPIRTVSEALNAKVDYDAKNMAVTITRPDAVIDASTSFAASIPMQGMYIMTWEQAMAKMQQPNFMILDVRPPDHRAQGYVAGSMHTPLPKLPSYFGQLTKGQTYGVYCVMDTNAAFAVAMLNMNGFKAMVIPGGVKGYEAAGGKLVKDTVPGYMDITPTKAKEMIDGGNMNLTVVDVSPMYAAGHLPGAVNIPLGHLEMHLGELNKMKPILVYCHTDEASMKGADILVKNGFSPVYRLQGNYKAWVDAGYPVEK